MKRCHSCGTAWDGGLTVGFSAVCPKCSAYAHVCRNCRLFKPSARNRCQSNTTEPPADPDRANWCEEFDWIDTPDAGVGGKPARDSGAGSDAKKRFDSLFGDT